MGVAILFHILDSLVKRCRELLPTIAKRLHRGEQEISAFIEQNMIGKRTRVYRYREDTGSLGSTHSERSILYNNTLIGVELTLLHAHQVGFRVGLAMLHIEGGDHELATKDVRVVHIEFVEQ